jgi:Domain of unknown function (DUF4396)
LLKVFAWISLAIAFACALFIAADETRRPQKMGIMNVVWPISALYFSVLAVWAYLRWGLGKTREAMQQQHGGGGHGGSDKGSGSSGRREPSASQVAIGTSHCGAGCAIADVICEFAIAAAGITLFGSMLLAEYTIDFAAAWALGIVFQYFSIKPMRNLSPGEGVVAAIKADTLSILAFQVGMYGWMALVHFVLFPQPHLEPFDPRYWLMMQIGMICGFATSYPMNRWLIRSGLKEAM